MYVPEQIKIEFAKKRSDARAAQEERLQKAIKKIPELADINKKKQQIAYNLTGMAFGSSPEDFEKHKKSAQRKLDELDIRRTELLCQNGLSEDYLHIRYSCDSCQDTGYSIKDGTMCQCMKNRIMDYCYASSNLNNGQTFNTYDFNVFNDEKQRNRMRKVYDFTLGYTNNLPSPTPLNIVIIGSTGLGKSFTLNCIAHAAVGKGLDVIKIAAYNIIDSMLQAVRGERPLPDYLSCDLLAIDDLGTEPMINNITNECLFNIINEREARGKATIIATNLSKDALFSRYGDRISSRLLTPQYNSVLCFYGEDIRLK